MRILVCAKQVPDTAQVRIDPATSTLIRAGVPSILNPYDGYALEAAARVRDARPDTEITALSMGPEQAKAALRDCLAMAADRAYLACDPAFGGSDTLATSYILSEAVRAVERLEGGFGLIFCGREAIDGETAQVGPELAEHLGYAQVTCALEARMEGDALLVRRAAAEGLELVAVKPPCVVSFTKPAWEPRLSTLRRRLAAARAEISVLSAGDLPGLRLDRAGLRGSPTRVKSTFVPPQRAVGVKLQGADAAKELFQLLRRAGAV